MKVKLAIGFLLIYLVLLDHQGMAQSSGQQKRAMQANLSTISSHPNDQKPFVPRLRISVKSQFPLQQAIGVEVISRKRLSGYLGYGQYSRFYTRLMLDQLPGKSLSQQARRTFIKERVQNGRVIELAGMYTPRVRQRLYGGLSLQFQRLSIYSTPQELVEHFDPSHSNGNYDKIQNLVDNTPFLKKFYETEVVYPEIRPIQVGILIGKQFVFSRLPRLGLHLEMSYQLTVQTTASVEGGGRLAQFLMTNYVNPILAQKAAESFSNFRYPTLALRVSYGF